MRHNLKRSLYGTALILYVASVYLNLKSTTSGLFTRIGLDVLAVDGTTQSITADSFEDSSFNRSDNHTQQIISPEQRNAKGLLYMSSEIPNKEDEVKVQVEQDEESTTTSGADNNEVKEHISNKDSTRNYPFKKYDGPVFVTKVLSDGNKDVQTVMAMLCYLQHAYNDKMNYDVIVFTTLAWKEENIKKLQDVAGTETKIIVAVEGPTLEEHFAQMSDKEVDTLHRRCNAKNETHSEPLTWYHYCREPGSRHLNSLGYAWQAEFRSYHIWNHPALKPYKYMFWLDTDARIGKIWDKDPFEMMIENDLILLYGGFPYGKTTYPIVKKKMEDVYGKAICYSKENEYGELYAGICKDDNQVFKMGQLAGAHHITNIEVFRKPIHQEFLQRLVGDYKFSRMYDDQMAVTIVALMEQILSNEQSGRTRLWRERSKNITLDILHHGMYDTERKEQGPRNKHKIWLEFTKRVPGLEERCKAVWE